MLLWVYSWTGRPLRHVLEVLKYIDRQAFDNLATKFRQYASCVGVVDTGYFRRRRTCPSSQPSYNEQQLDAAITRLVLL